ncbi:hypothetical protein ASG36_11220 [Geodermatophilus sp. Leaf369]|uniref:TetR/AcrR family transcriptional regulator n=1 Tax=Geodermatophilus sp. Leaf369 TaxID=1736354 RepID=UPI000700F90F|nr:TetR/AcrR family transcriptional regulator [Geodermatophilus sp. Leaf369]KQS58603.1 hypothetical protein ASG36_11220 [Geodermatophilus sp. Leaf369]
MPRASREQRAVHHDRIITEAARLVRELGPDGVTVPGVMAAAGLTPGGFYKHFESKDDLLVQADDAAIRTRADRLAALVADDPATARERFLDTYLSTAHRDHPGRGCPTAALAVDVARPGVADAVRDRYVDGVRELVGTLATLRDDDGPAALADLATMVGAVLLARATSGDELSEGFLTAARARLADPS